MRFFGVLACGANRRTGQAGDARHLQNISMSMPAAAPTSLLYAPTPRLSWRAVALVAAVHAGLLLLLLSLDVIPLPAAVSTLVVDIIQAAPPTPPADISKPVPRPVEMKPLPRRQPTPAPQAVLAAQTATPAAAEALTAKETPPAPPAQPAPAAVTQPRFDADYLSNPAPAYPSLSRRMGEEGKVVLRVYVEASGRPSQIEIRTSSGSPRLDQAAQEAVWRWKFVPARRGDEGIAAWVLIPVTFTLKN